MKKEYKEPTLEVVNLEILLFDDVFYKSGGGDDRTETHKA